MKEETPWSDKQEPVHPEPKAKKEKPPVVEMVAVIEMLEQWERQILKLPGSKADQEYAQVRAVFQKIGERVARSLAAEHQNKCAHCKKPLPSRGPVDTIPRPAPETALGWINQFACSAKCADALRTAMHDREIKRLSEANA